MLSTYQRRKLRDALELKVETLWSLLDECPEEEDYVLEEVIKIEEELSCK